MSPKKPDNMKDRMAAGVGTLLIAVAIVVWLIFTSLRWDHSALAASAIPELSEDEEIFIDPMLTEIQDAGEEDAVNNDAPAPAPLGEPELADKPNERLVVPGDNPKPAPKEEKLVTQKQPSPVKSTTPSKTDEEAQRIQSQMSGKFSPHNGKNDGKAGSTGSGGTGVGVKGNATGRVFISCPKPDVTLQHKTVVVVSVVVNEAGRVTSATASGSASAQIRRACERAAMGARWEAKKGSGDSRGSITFTITPK